MAVQRYKRKDGSTAYLAIYRGPEGQRYAAKVKTVKADATAKDHERAELAARVRASELRCSVENGTWTPPAEEAGPKFLGLHELVDKFLKEYRSRSGSVAYYNDPAKAWKRLMPDRPARAVTVSHVEAFAKARAKEVGPSTVRKNLVALGTLFRWAQARGYVAGNPADPEKVRRPAEPPHRAEYLTAEAERKLLEASPPWLQRVIRFAINTGLDRAEVCGITWDRVDEAAGVIWAPREKTGAHRAVPINATLRAILKEAKEVGGIGDAHRIFLDAGRHAIHPEALKSALRRAYADAKLPGRQPFKILRHTFASRLAMAGVSLTAIAKLLGHTTAQITERYAHLSPSFLRDAMATLDQAPATSEETSSAAEAPEAPEAVAQVVVL